VTPVSDVPFSATPVHENVPLAPSEPGLPAESLGMLLQKPQHRGQGRKNQVRSLCQIFPRQLEDGPAAQCEVIALGAISLPAVLRRRS